MSADAKTPFNQMAAKDAVVRREGLPDPARVVGSGITTKEVLDWLEARSPKTPRPELVIDDPAVRHAAEGGARRYENARLLARRERFEARGLKGRADFATARDYRGVDRER